MLQKEDLFGELNEKQRDAVDEIYISTIKLQRLIGDILTTQKLDLGKLDFNKEDIQISELLNGVLKEFAPLINEKEISMSIKCDENMYINSDKDRISQVFSNMIKNAVDFVTPKIGDIVIGAKDDVNFIEFFVQDNGPGISIESQKEIFKKFYQIDTSSSRKRSGSGLGLTICKGIVEGLGGKIRVKSKENIKTTFYFKIPKNPIKLSIKNISTKNK
jgi:signal transduction histidine kinase